MNEEQLAALKALLARCSDLAEFRALLDRLIAEQQQHQHQQQHQGGGHA